MSGINDDPWEEYVRRQAIEELEMKRRLREARFAEMDPPEKDHQDDDSPDNGE